MSSSPNSKRRRTDGRGDDFHDGPLPRHPLGTSRWNGPDSDSDEDAAPPAPKTAAAGSSSLDHMRKNLEEFNRTRKHQARSSQELKLILGGG